MDHLQFILFRNSEYGGKQFLTSDSNPSGWMNGNGIIERAGECQWNADEVLPWICEHVGRSEEEPHCLDPVDVEGHCSKICGKILN